MQTRILRLFNALAACAAMALATAAGAGTASVTSAEGDTIRFEYKGDRLRVNMSGQEESFMVLRDGRVYAVSGEGGQQMVIDLSQAMNMFGGMAGAATPDMVAQEVISLEPTGRKEQHAGITGEVYILRFRMEDGTEKQDEVVLTDDPRARAFRDAMHQFATTVARSVSEDYQKASDDMQGRLTAMNKGVLRYGGDMTVSELTDTDVDATRFDLPAAPMDLSNLGSILGGGQAQGSASGQQKSQGGNPLSGLLGAFGGASGEKESGAEETGEEESAEDTSATGEIGKAFGRLFGN